MIIKPYRGENICVATFQWSTETYQTLNGIPGYKRWPAGTRNFLFKASGSAVLYLYKHFPNAKWTDGSEKFIVLALEEVSKSEALRKHRLSQFPEIEKCGYDYKTTPHQKQHEAFLISRDTKVFAYFMEQGTGKTKVTLDNAAYLYLAGEIDTLVIICVNNGHRKWIEDEVPKHLPDSIPHITYCHSPKWNSDKSHFEFRNALRAKKMLRIFSFNIEAFSTSSPGAKTRLEAVLGPRTMLALDESTRIKSRDANRTKYLLKQAPDAGWRRILTGTPVTKGVEDLYTQLRFLDPYILGYETFTAFRSNFCDMGGYMGREIIGYKNLDELTAKLDVYSYRCLKSECLDLPEKIYMQPWKFDLTTKQKKLYDELAHEYVTEFKKEVLTAPLALSRLMRLHQISCNLWPFENVDQATGRSTWATRPIEKPEDDPRFRALMDIIEETEGKIMIWSRFRSNTDFLAKELKKLGFIEFKTFADAKRFQNDPKVRGGIANPANFGIAIDLFEAEAMIFYSNDFDLEKRIQAEDRGHRRGLRHVLNIFDLVARGTSDMRILASHKKKKNIAEEVLGDPQSFFLVPKSEILVA